MRIYQSPCEPGSGVSCVAVCPAGTYVVSGGCDITNSGSISESMPGFDPALHPEYPPTPSDFTVWDRWSCETGANGGDVQTAHALCCAP